ETEPAQHVARHCLAHGLVQRKRALRKSQTRQQRKQPSDADGPPPSWTWTHGLPFTLMALAARRGLVGGNAPPWRGALRHGGIVTGRVVAVVPELLRRRRRGDDRGWRRWRWNRSTSRQLPLPGHGALRHVRVVALRIAAVIPVMRRTGLRPQHHGGRLKWIGIGIHRRRIEVPDPAHHPPPAEAPVVAVVYPAAAAPQFQVVLVEAMNVARPEAMAHLVLAMAALLRLRRVLHQRRETEQREPASGVHGRFYGRHRASSRVLGASALREAEAAAIPAAGAGAHTQAAAEARFRSAAPCGRTPARVRPWHTCTGCR